MCNFPIRNGQNRAVKFGQIWPTIWPEKSNCQILSSAASGISRILGGAGFQKGADKKEKMCEKEPKKITRFFFHPGVNSGVVFHLAFCIYRRPPWKCDKNFVLVKFFRFSKNHEKTRKTQWKRALFRHFFLIKNVFFIQQSSLKCIIIFHFLYRKCWFFHLKKRIILLIFFIQKTHIFYKSFCITKNVFFIDRNTIFKKKIAQYENGILKTFFTYAFS